MMQLKTEGETEEEEPGWDYNDIDWE